MDTLSLVDGLSLTIVSLLVVFGVLAAIWGIIEIIAKIVQATETESDTSSQPSASKSQQTKTQTNTNQLTPNTKHQQVAELMALVLASEDEPGKKFEIVESKRLK